MCLLSCFSRVQLFATHGLPGLIRVHGILRARTLTGMGCHFLLQEIFPSQKSIPCLCISCIGRWVLLCYAVLSCSVVSDSMTPWTVAYQAPLWDSPSKNTRVGCSALSRDLPNPQIEPRSPALQVDSLPSEPLGKPKNSGVGILGLLQGIFPTLG